MVHLILGFVRREARAARRMIARAWLVALAPLLAASSSVRADERPPDLEAIRSTLGQYAAGLKTLQGKYRWWSTLDTELPLFDTGGSRRDSQGEVEFDVDLVRGMLRRDERRTFAFVGKHSERLELEIHELQTFNGAKTYHLRFTHARTPVETALPPDFPLQLDIAARTISRFSTYPWEFTGWFGQGTGPGVAGILGRNQLRFDGEEEINGARCLRVLADQGNAQFTVWLDPRCDYLPRRRGPTRYPTDGAGNDPTERERLKEVSDVFEFRQFADLSTGVECWFPVRMRARDRVKTVETQIEELQINPSIDPSRFKIAMDELPDGVKVSEHVAMTQNSQVGMTQKSSYTGGRQDLWEERHRLSEQEDAKLDALTDKTPVPPGNAPGKPFISQQARDAIYWYARTAIGCAAVLFLVFVFIRARRGKCQDAEHVNEERLSSS